MRLITCIMVAFLIGLYGGKEGIIRHAVCIVHAVVEHNGKPTKVHVFIDAQGQQVSVVPDDLLQWMVYLPDDKLM